MNPWDKFGTGNAIETHAEFGRLDPKLPMDIRRHPNHKLAACLSRNHSDLYPFAGWKRMRRGGFSQDHGFPIVDEFTAVDSPPPDHILILLICGSFETAFSDPAENIFNVRYFTNQLDFSIDDDGRGDFHTGPGDVQSIRHFFDLGFNPALNHCLFDNRFDCIACGATGSQNFNFHAFTFVSG
jgi:hypothetical protein